jgi:DNA modification methylase
MVEPVTSRMILGDCLQEMPKLDAESIDLTISSPPYNVGIEYGENGRESDALPFSEYKKWADQVMQEIARLTKLGGRVCWEIGGSGRNMPMSWAWQDAAYKAGFGLFSEIGIEHRKTNQCAWGSYLQADNVFTVPNFHMLYVFYKGTPTKRSEGITTVQKDEWLEWTRGYWKMNYSGGPRVHPAPFPEELPLRCMRLFGHLYDNVLDCFSGSGTTAVVAWKNHRNFIGIEKAKEYYDYGVQRLEDVKAAVYLPGLEF